MCFAKPKSENFSHAQVAARGFYSVCAYHLSVSVIEQEAKAASFHQPSIFCSSTVPKLYAKASAEIFVKAAGS